MGERQEFAFVINTTHQKVVEVISRVLQPGMSLYLNSRVLNVLSLKTEEMDLNSCQFFRNLSLEGL